MLKRLLSKGEKGPPKPVRVAEYRSMALADLAQSLSRADRPTILDLGGASEGNLEFYRRFSRKIRFADIGAMLEAPQRPTVEELFSDIESCAERSVFDAIFCWDIVNYLEPDEVRSMGRLLSRCSRSGTAIFMLVSTRREIPATPTRFRVLDGARLRYEFTSMEKRPAPRYSSTLLQKLLPQFSRTRTYLLRNGMEERVLGCTHREQILETVIAEREGGPLQSEAEALLATAELPANS